MKEIHKFFLLLLSIIFVLLITVLATWSLSEKDIDNLNYCIENGWDGITINMYKLVCYKEIKDLSGMGFYYTYSEELE